LKTRYKRLQSFKLENIKTLCYCQLQIYTINKLHFSQVRDDDFSALN